MPRALRATRSAMCNKRRQPIEEEQQRLGLGAPTRSTGLPSHSQPRQPPCGLLAAALYNCAAPMMSQLGEPPHHHEAAWRLDPGRGGEVTRTSKELASQTPEAAPKCASSPTTGFVPGISTTDLPWHLTVKLRGRTMAPDSSRGYTLFTRTRGDTTDSHGTLQRLLGIALPSCRQG